jgi:diadenosine tetraphosphatase ApaH/serine/threonine PP2A family protein phosphatase
VKYAIISDIHGNLAALQQSLNRIDELHCDRIVCLGDIVGYGPFPNECCKVIQDRADASIAGNHDHAAIDRISTHYFNKYAKAAMEWTIEKLSDENKEFLRDLPMKFVDQDLLFVHASPPDPAAWDYVLSLYDAEIAFNAFENHACFIGHSHHPIAFSYEDGEFPRVERLPNVKFFSGFRYIINVGSVGQPRDENRDASFGIYDSEERMFELVRQPYNIKETQEAMVRQNLPTFLIERLAFGR